MILDAGGGTVDIAMHQIEASKTHPGESQLSERLRSRCLLLGSSMLDVQAEVNLLLPLFGGEEAYVQWKSEDPQSYISQVTVSSTVMLCRETTIALSAEASNNQTKHAVYTNTTLVVGLIIECFSTECCGQPAISSTHLYMACQYHKHQQLRRV
jgi:hypothetical protein